MKHSGVVGLMQWLLLGYTVDHTEEYRGNVKVLLRAPNCTHNALLVWWM